jgi:type I restriction enzyme S subunit
LVPESWGVVELGEIAKIERGKFSHRPRNEPRFYGGEYPFVQTGDVSNCDGFVRSHTQTLNEAGLAISKMFPAGTILITIAANIGFTGILGFDSACPDSLIGITPNKNVNTEYLNYYLMTQQPEMDRLAPKGTQKNINIQFLRPWPVPLPSPEEQITIAQTFQASDKKKALARQKRDHLQVIFHTFLHELMTGKTRVIDAELQAL